MNKYFFISLLFFSITQTIVSKEKITSEKDPKMTTLTQVQQIILQLTNNESLSTQEIMRLGQSPDASVVMIQTTKELRLSSLDVLIELGRPILPEDKPATLPQRPGQIISEPHVIAYLVELLEDNYSDIRSKACSALAEFVPPALMKTHIKAILKAIQHYPDMDKALLLLGKTDIPEALEILNHNSILSNSSEDDAIMVRARLGDKKAEDAIIKAYSQANSPEEKGALAPRLGYVASQQTILLLAREMRNPAFYYWNKKSRRSLRIHIIEGLHRAFPAEPLFWTPYYTPADDSYYDSIEKWLVGKLKISWNVPRPEFLYQEDAPSELRR